MTNKNGELTQLTKNMESSRIEAIFDQWKWWIYQWQMEFKQQKCTQIYTNDDFTTTTTNNNTNNNASKNRD